jgi:hypothetical protein
MMDYKKYLVVFLLFAHPCFGADYYFSQSTGSDAAETNSIETPWQTIAKINSTSYSAGDNIYLKSGDTWTIGSGEDGIVIDFNGVSNESRIVIGKYGTGNNPIITAEAQTGDGNRGGETEVCIGFSGSNGNYVTIQDLDLRGASEECVIDGYGASCGSNLIVQRCTLSGSGFTSEGMASLYSGGNQQWLNNIFNNDDSTQYNKGIELSGGENDIVRGNTFYYCASYGGAIRYVHATGTDGLIEKNYIFGGASGESYHWGIVVRDHYADNSATTVRNNIINLSTSELSGSSVFGFTGWDVAGYSNCVTYILNNTIYLNGTGSTIRLLNYRFVVRNNILLNAAYRLDISSSIPEGYVTFSNLGSDLIDTYTAENQFVDEGSHVTSNINLVASIDIGADEYVATPYPSTSGITFSGVTIGQ